MKLLKKKKNNNVLDIITNSSFLKTESIIDNNNQNELTNIKHKEVDEIILKYLEIKNKLNELWNKLD